MPVRPGGGAPRAIRVLLLYNAPLTKKHDKSTMASSKRRGEAAPMLTSDSIADQVAKFLKTGGQIEEVPRGVSGQTSVAAKKHITISKKTTA
jgi:hypothetical protein